jgi:hypothetical protein
MTFCYTFFRGSNFVWWKNHEHIFIKKQHVPWAAAQNLKKWAIQKIMFASQAGWSRTM